QLAHHLPEQLELSRPGRAAVLPLLHRLGQCGGRWLSARSGSHDRTGRPRRQPGRNHVVVSMSRAPMRSWFLPSCGTGRAVLACACVLSTACGGTDGDLQGAETPSIEQRDPCVAAEELALDLIENFEFRRAPDWWVSIAGTPGAEL